MSRDVLQKGTYMGKKEQLIALRKCAGMNRRQFCEYFGIPYRTMSDWEHGKREMPEYLLRLMVYRVEMDLLAGEETVKD